MKRSPRSRNGRAPALFGRGLPALLASVMLAIGRLWRRRWRWRCGNGSVPRPRRSFRRSRYPVPLQGRLQQRGAGLRQGRARRRHPGLLGRRPVGRRHRALRHGAARRPGEHAHRAPGGARRYPSLRVVRGTAGRLRRGGVLSDPRAATRARTIALAHGQGRAPHADRVGTSPVRRRIGALSGAGVLARLFRQPALQRLHRRDRRAARATATSSSPRSTAIRASPTSGWMISATPCGSCRASRISRRCRHCARLRCPPRSTLLLAHPQWRDHSIARASAASGRAWAASRCCCCGGAGLTTSAGPVVDAGDERPRLKAAVGYVPYFGQPFLPAFGRDGHGLDNVTLPYLAIGGTADTSAPIYMTEQGLRRVAGTRGARRAERRHARLRRAVDQRHLHLDAHVPRRGSPRERRLAPAAGDDGERGRGRRRFRGPPLQRAARAVTRSPRRRSRPAGAAAR